MRFWSILAVILVLALGTSLAMADAATGKTLRGAITKIDGANVTVGETTFATADTTVVTTIAGEKKAASDLAVGQTITVKLSDDGKTAATIVIAPKGGGRERAPGSPRE